MKILFLARHKWPHVGGVETHVRELGKRLKIKGESVKIISEEDIRFPKIKYLGLLYIWFWLFKNRKLIKWADIIHCHDVFIWYLPFRFLYSKKPVYTTFHGWEGTWPIPWRNIMHKRLASRLSWGTIAVGKYIEKYYGVKVSRIIYGGNDHLGGAKAHPRGVNRVSHNFRGVNHIVFVGRLEKDTGVLDFIEQLKINNLKFKTDFVGDGSLRKECEKFGKVHGFVDPNPFLEKADICVPGGYLSYIEAKSLGCKIKVFANNPLKIDYWVEIQKVKKFPTWGEIADEYISLYNSSK